MQHFKDSLGKSPIDVHFKNNKEMELLEICHQKENPH